MMALVTKPIISASTDGSDVDLFVLTKNEATAELIKDLLLDSVERLQVQFGADVRPIVMSYHKATHQLAAGNKFLSEVLQNVRLVSGEIPTKLRLGKTIPNPKSR